MEETGQHCRDCFYVESVYIFTIALHFFNACLVLSPLASSMFAPGIGEIAESLHAARNGVVVCQAGFVVMLGIGPLVLAPLSETFGRKRLYLVCFTIFTLLQIPSALAKSLPLLIILRIMAGFFGSMC